MSAEITRIDLSAGSLDTVMVDGQPHIVLKPAVEELGLSYPAQARKLKSRSWAVVAQTATTGADGKTYEMDAVPVRTFLMLLATINENRVNEAARPVLVAFQNETADAIEAFWIRGGAISKHATDVQLDALEQQIEDRRARRALGLIQLIAAMDDNIDPKWKRSRQLHHYAEASGEAPEIAPEDRALLVETYLKDCGLTKDECRSVRSNFGRNLAAAFKLEHNGQAPKESFGLVDGRERAVKSYTEADRPLFDKVWKTFFADRYPAQQQLGGAA
ncbi:phage antirepressor N-terminal domain-containing protein [Streptomyces sp. ME18-1-4]|uniref:phage antirepressor N-terminal domain-containing protein n=1 Tax=Streptomyces sp. ME18-1-4 TaxID=3028685 RepID=UPI0029B07A25|nr:phage antirepressor N-terminal domain-containing protein [Streptomyces sp. ME18-1-4]MDX3243495.1 phage antirepressor N-terminal domain-containing protein [Streptomyces sp. ME18-1-4]